VPRLIGAAEVPTVSPISRLAGVVLPAMASARGQTMLALQFQFDRSQWLDGPSILGHQFEQLRVLIDHARTQAPFYRDHLRRAQIFSLGGLTPASFTRWPLLSRSDVLAAGESLLARTMPAAHGEIIWNSTTGSTGQPVRVATSALGTLFQDALVMRSHFWYGLDLSLKFGAIRSGTHEPGGTDWGPALRGTFESGPSVLFGLSEDLSAQLDWLRRESPAYLLSRGHTLHALIHESRARGTAPEGIKALLSFADRPPDDLRMLAREAWDVPVFDTYSAGEFGVLALQCPDHEHLHVQSENVLLEILREDGSACAPGEVGRVVVTDLHNFAMPLIRYVIGDFAEVGEPCPCGRGLPVIRRIAGRSSNMAVDVNGRRFWPLLSPFMWINTPITQRQFVQLSRTHVEVRFVAPRDLTSAEEASIRAGLIATFRHPFEFSFVRVDEIARAPGAKFEEFISHVDGSA
jgi:phenylacetate-CoA ligase